MLRHTLSLFLICSLAITGFAQTTVTGLVTDNLKQPVIGATVVEKGTNNGRITDENGAFTLTIADVNTAILVVTYSGYEENTIALKGQTSITVLLKDNTEGLGEVMVVGYGTSTKKEFTGASSNVGGEELQKLNIPRVDQALQGQIAGVTINTNSGSPGGGAAIRIRGLSTFGDNDPLILVDGVVYDSEGLNSLNPNDIESVNVLKDATAGIYGVRAANGVILIETKKGRANSKPTIELSTYFGVQQAARKLSLLNATEYAVIKNETFSNGGDALPFSNTRLGEGTDWQDAVFQNANIQNYNVTISGGSEKTTYSIGGSYFSQDGIVGGDKANFTRMNARVNLNTEMSSRMRLSSVFLYTNEERDALPENGIGSVLYNTINAFPTDPVQEANGTYSYLEEVSDIINPIAQMQNTYNTSYVDKFVGKEEIAFDITKNLTFTNRFSYNFALVDQKVFSPLVWYGPGKAQNSALNANLDPTQVEIAPGTLIDRGASVYEARATYSDLNFESYVNHEYTFKLIHRLKTTAGISVFSRNGKGLGGTAFNIPNNSVEYADISANLAPGGFLNNANSFQFQERLLSTFIRTEYRYGTKYNGSFILRRDGSSKFGPNNRYGIFPTVSGSWMFSEEDFYGLDKIKYFKVRMSYGISGNDQIPNFAYRGLLNGEGVYVFDDIITSGAAIGRAGNPDLKWETTRQFNIGTDLKVGKRFDLTANYFIKNTRDLLFQPDVSGVLGTAGPGSYPPIINAGDVSNKGVELELRYSSDFTRKLRWSTSLNTTYLKNEVLKTPEGVEFLPGASFGVGGNIATRFQEGYAIGYFIGYETDGVYQTQAEIDNSSVVQDGAKPGDLKFVDQNGDGKISFNDDSDQKELGSAIPTFTFGYNLNVSYQGFDFSANLYSAIGQEIIRNYERQQPYANQLTYNINRWTGPESTNENPRLTTDLNRNTIFSDYYVEKGSFLRFKNIQVGYTLPKGMLSKLKIQSTRVYIAANNLITLTNYQGYDPDLGSFGGALAAGIDYGFYPQARTFMTGLAIKF
ncbi:MAG: TonB-linked SusC/RagA family outer membrane protein [Pseudoalteromonas distincta]|jgi:TonB-linked SusC/RagA family outer membrane protein